MDPQLQQRMMIYAGFIPGAVALLVLMAGWYLHALRVSRLDQGIGDTPARPSDGPRWLLPLLLALGYAGGDYASHYTVHFWPHDNTYRYTHAIALIALLGMGEGLVRIAILPALLLRTMVYAGAFWMLSEGYTHTVFSGVPSLWAYALVGALGAALIATGADHGAQSPPPPPPPPPPGGDSVRRATWVDAVTWILIGAGMMPILYMNNFGIGAQLPAGIIAVMSAALLVSLVFKDFSLARGGVTVLVGFVLTLVTGSIIQTGALDLPSVLLVALAPGVLLIPLPVDSGMRRLLARLAVLMVIFGGAFASLHFSQPSPDTDDGDTSGLWDYD